ncbi:MAG: hypothetical protein LC775_19125 [Acidobacteria bacterium]|nr:hypothetical protein [Acidobacteriota bacterium]
MSKVDMSAKAVTIRLKRVSQLRRLGLALGKAKIKRQKNGSEAAKTDNYPSSRPEKRRSE